MAKKQTKAVPSQYQMLMAKVANCEARTTQAIRHLEVLASSRKEGQETASAVASGILLLVSKIEKDELEKELHNLPPGRRD